MTNLTNKIETLATRLDTVIARLDTSNTKLTEIAAALATGGGSIEAAAIVEAINNLRGSGPENTIKSVNQSLWNLAGPAPGYTLTDLHTQLVALKNNLGIPTGDATTTALGLLASLQYAFTTNNAATLYGLLWAIHQTLTLPGSIDRTVLEELDLIRLAANATSSGLNPPTIPTTPPPGSVDLCASPYSSTGVAVNSVYTALFAGPVTIATWGGTPPSGITVGTHIIAGDDTLHSDDWSQYSIYVASRATTFGVKGLAAQRFRTNQWVVLSGDEDFTFYVDGNYSLTVTICGEGTAGASIVLTSEPAVGSYGTYEVIVWPETWPRRTLYMRNNDNISKPCVCYGDMSGYTITPMGVGCSFQDNTGSVNIGDFEEFTVPTARTEVLLLRLDSTQFSVTITGPVFPPV